MLPSQRCPSWRTQRCCFTPSLSSASSTSFPSLWAGTSHRGSAGSTSTESSRTSTPLMSDTSQLQADSQLTPRWHQDHSRLLSVNMWLRNCWPLIGTLGDFQWTAASLGVTSESFWLISQSTLLIFCLALILSCEVSGQSFVWTSCAKRRQMQALFYMICK